MEIERKFLLNKLPGIDSVKDIKIICWQLKEMET